MSEEEKVDAIIVGGGVAGLACAYKLATEGKEVVVIERGSSCGDKNLTGGRIYTYSLLNLLGEELMAEAPLERPIVKEQIAMTHAKGAMTIDYTDYGFTEGVPQSYSILHAVFDPWLAEKAEEAGAMIAPGILVEELIERDGKIVGVKMGDEEMFSDIVIAADGVNSFLAQQAGLRSDLNDHEVAVGVKEVIELPEETITDRFGLQAGEGAARLFLGVSEGMGGGGFLYTNKSSISLGLVVSPKDLGKHNKRLHEVMQDFKMHPAVYPLIAGGTTTEYGAHLVGEAGYHGLPKQLYREGLVLIGDAAGLCINMGSTIRGMDLAIASGVAAAEAILGAKSPSEIGPAYTAKLNEAVLPTMKVYAGYPVMMELPRLFTEYPLMANEMMHFLFAVDGSVPAKMPKAMLDIVKKNVGIGAILSDGWKGFKAL
ncbi:MAG: FAD-dependent oxidoreductase [Sporomusaceae bacterium]|nr:FAD-dependent oxidoreductase [Sporomusaceae bacterium]